MNACVYYALSSTNVPKKKNGIAMQGNWFSRNKGVACFLVFRKRIKHNTRFCKTSNRSNVFLSSNPMHIYIPYM
jgi:hypothetical protein